MVGAVDGGDQGDKVDMSIAARIQSLDSKKRALLAARLMREVESAGLRSPEPATSLTAFVVLEPSAAAPDGAALRAALMDRLPEYMTPSRFQIVEDLPLSPNGKIDRAALTRIATQGFARVAEHPAAPASAAGASELDGTLRSALAGIWRRTLRIECDPGEASFFELGGHSLLATRLLLEVEKEIGIRVSVSAFFEDPSLSGMAKAVRASALARIRAAWRGRPLSEMDEALLSLVENGARDGLALARCARTSEAAAERMPTTASGNDGYAETQAEPAMSRQAEGAPLELSFAQRRVWALLQLEGPSAAYNMPIALRIRGPLPVGAWRRALAEIVARHDALRQRIASRGGAPTVELLAPEVALQRFDLSGLAGAALEREIRRHAEEEGRRAFDLERDLPLRGRWLEIAVEEHVALITFHHIAFDGWSMGVFARELTRLYQAFRDGLDSPLPSLAFRYSDYAAWQRGRSAGVEMAKQLAYWRKRLAGAPEQLELPADFARPSLPSYGGRICRTVVDTGLSEGLRALARQESATLFMLLLAAFQAALSRMSGQADICVGTPVANRSLPETEDMIGLFVNTVVMRGRAAPEIGFRAFLQETKRAALEAYANQDAPFEKVVEEVGAARSLSRNPVFQAMLLFQERPTVQVELAGAVVEYSVTDNETAKFDVTLGVEDSADGLYLAWEYATDLFSEATARAMLDRFVGMLRAIVANPDVAIGRIPILTPDERRDWEAFNATARARSDEDSFLNRFRQRVEQAPDAVAATFQGDALSYGELDRRSDRVARALAAQIDVAADTRVGLRVERSLDMVAGILGILKSGAAYVPIDPNYPADRIRFMVSDSGIRVLVTQSGLIQRFSDFDLSAICVDDESQLAAFESGPLPPGGRACDLAYVIYTSGSTGQPKGVMIERGSLDCFLDGIAHRLDGYGFSRALGLTTLSFDIAALEILLPLALGLRLDLLSRDEARDPAALRAALDSQEPTLAQATPATWRMLAAAGWRAGPELTILVGGEAFPREIAEAFGGARAVWNVYGPTEATIWATAHLASARPDAPELIGEPLANYRAYVVDSLGELAAPGTPGELWLAGEGLARGYLNRPELTAERFGEAEILGRRERIYRTGDRARRRRDGSLEFLGRLDRQLKLRGFRVEPGEVEAALCKHPQVREAIVDVARERGAESLAAFLVMKESSGVDVASLRTWLARSLPEYMIPATYRAMERFPLTPNGKIDRKALLKTPLRSPERADGGAVAGRAGALLEIWRTELANPGIGPQDDFFDSGGDSMRAIQVVAKAREAGLELKVADIFRKPTIEQWAAEYGERERPPPLGAVARSRAILTMEDLAEWSVMVPIQPSGSKPPLFMIHDITSSVLIYRTLANFLPPDQPLYALQSPPVPYGSIEEMARRYLSEIRKVWPQGRLMLGGYCFGGGVALEMGRMLAEEGERPRLLVMIDGRVPDLLRYLPGARLKARYLAKRFSGESLRDLARQAIAKVRRRVASGLKEADDPRADRVRDPFAMVNWSETATVFTRAHSRAVDRYRPKPYDGDMLLFRSNQGEASERCLGWDRYVKGRIDVVDIEADHGTVVATHGLKQIGPALGARIDELLAVSEKRDG